MVNSLVEVVQVLGLLALGVVCIDIIFNIIEIFVKKITRKKREEQDKKAFLDFLIKVAEIYENANVEKKQTTQKTTKKTTKNTKKDK